MEPKRPVGRPRKSTVTKPKRPVGRPRKEAVKQTIPNSDVSGVKSNPFSSVFAADPVFQNIERQLEFDEL